jgi:uncharacterized protein YprB with RNaseH-like and TPR domain
MLKSTFCHLPGTGCGKEKKLWDSGIRNWEDLMNADCCIQGLSKCRKCKSFIDESFRQLHRDNTFYFAERLPSNQHWRLFTQFRHLAAYVDIETTGLYYGSSITAIALYDGRNVFQFVQGGNLPDFKRKIREYKLIITYNGKSFDLPFIERTFDMVVSCPHIDLRFLLHGLGFRGGLKACEKNLGIDRPRGMEDLDGYFAVLLWEEYKKSHDEKALETLLAYNIQDVISLEKLLVIAYNRKLKDTPFANDSIDNPIAPENPFSIDTTTVHRIRRMLDRDLID